MLQQLVRFGLVGVVATVVHFVVAVACVRQLGTDPRSANVAGFAVAFVASFIGQRRWTFSATTAPWRTALPRYFVVSVLGFAVNAASYAWLLTHTSLRYDVALAIVLLAVATLTFVLSRWWAFRGH